MCSAAARGGRRAASPSATQTCAACAARPRRRDPRLPPRLAAGLLWLSLLPSAGALLSRPPPPQQHPPRLCTPPSAASRLSHQLPPLCTPPRAPPRAPAPALKVVAGRRSQVAANKVARRNYEILDDYEAGVSLVGTEVKSCRAGKMNLRDGYVALRDGEAWLHNVHIARHGSTGAFFQHDERRPRRLLLHRREIEKLARAVDAKGLTVVPLSAYFNEKSFLKVEIGLARGKQLQDKREDLKRKDQARDVARQLKGFI